MFSTVEVCERTHNHWSNYWSRHYRDGRVTATLKRHRFITLLMCEKNNRRVGSNFTLVRQIPSPSLPGPVPSS